MQERDEETMRTPKGEGTSVPEEDRQALSEEDRRPTPVRMAMEVGDEEDAEDHERTRVLQEEEGGSTWVVTVSGRSASGILPLRTVPLMELSFAKAESPDRPLRRALRYGVNLADINDQELLDSLRDSEPFQDAMERRDDPENGEQKGKSRRSRNS